MSTENLGVDGLALRSAGGATPLRSGSAAVHAAGAVCWRLHEGELQVLLVHRPRYDDWSWPKGKLEAGEHYAVAAVREVQEETGLDISLGVALPTARYRVGDSIHKDVHYWAARIPDGVHPAPPRPKEVDETEWVSVSEAHARLTRRADRVQLQAVADAWQEGTLDTWAFLVVRHGFARPRTGWGHEDAGRPLVEAGRAQAEDLRTLLAAWSPNRILSSPWLRCTATVSPFVSASKVKYRTKGKLSENGHRSNPSKTSALIAKQLQRGQTVVICTHRPVLGTVLGVLAGNCSAGISRSLPSTDPFLAPGEVLVCHVSRRSTRVVAVERHQARTAP